MKKVKEYLDKNFYGEGTCILKDNGHYNVQGDWEYPNRSDENRFTTKNLDIKRSNNFIN